MKVTCFECNEEFEYEVWTDENGKRVIPEFPVCGEC